MVRNILKNFHVIKIYFKNSIMLTCSHSRDNIIDKFITHYQKTYFRSIVNNT